MCPSTLLQSKVLVLVLQSKVLVLSSSVVYVRRGPGAAWRLRDVTFLCPNAALCSRWVGALTEQLSTLGTTPDL